MNIKFSSHDAVMEKHSLDMLIVQRLKSQIIKKSLRASKPMGIYIYTLAKIDQDYLCLGMSWNFHIFKMLLLWKSVFYNTTASDFSERGV